MKKIFLSLFSFVLISCSLFFVFACNKNNLAELSGFNPDTEIETSYNCFFEIPILTVKDKDENLYICDISVTDSKNNNVEITNGEFKTDDIDGYKINYTITYKNKSYTKYTQIVVKDKTSPTVIIEDCEVVYHKNDTVILPEVTVQDDLDINSVYTYKVMHGDTQIEVNINDDKYYFIAESIGEYDIIASCTDSSGNIGSDNKEFYVRDTAKKGEIDILGTNLASNSIRGIDNNTKMDLEKGFVTQSIGNVTSREDGFVYISSRFQGSSLDPAKYPGLKVSPMSSKEELLSLEEEGFDKITFSLYLEYDSVRYIYTKISGAQVNFATLQPNQWTTVSLNIDDVINSYENIKSGETLLFYIGNDSLYTVDHTIGDFKVYIDGIFCSKNITERISDDFGNKNYHTNEKIDLSTLKLNGNYYYTVTFNGKTDILDINEEYQFVNNGEYVFSANGYYTLRGSVSKTVKVTMSIDEIKELKTYLLQADKNDNDYNDKYNQFITSAELLDKAQKTEIQYVDTLLKLNNVSVIDDKVIYFDSVVGKNQVKVTQSFTGMGNVNTDFSEYIGSLDFINDTYTKFTLKSYSTNNNVYFLKINFESLHQNVDSIENYSQLQINLMTNKFNSTRKNIGLRMYNSDGANKQQFELTDGQWQTITVDLSKFTSWEDINMRFFDSGWGFISNNAEICLGSIVAVKSN